MSNNQMNIPEIEKDFPKHSRLYYSMGVTFLAKSLGLEQPLDLHSKSDMELKRMCNRLMKALVRFNGGEIE